MAINNDNDTFHVYLPSNASMDIFPNNKPGDYQVQMKTPIILQQNGDWEVGVESVCYHSAIDNKNETEKIELTARSSEKMSINDIFNYPYVLTEDGKWSYDWIPLDTAKYYGDSDMAKVCASLNTGNNIIMKDKTKKVYEFYVKRWGRTDYYAFRSFSSGLTVRLDSTLSRHLGFGYDHHIFEDQTADVKKDDATGNINKTNYRIKIFDANVVKRKARITLKTKSEKPLNLAALVKRWNETIGKTYGETASTKSNKFIVIKRNPKLTLYFSPSICRVIKRHAPLIGVDTFWGDKAYSIPARVVEDVWYVDIYGDEIKDNLHTYQHHGDHLFTVTPRQYATVEDFINWLNPYMVKVCKNWLREYKYDEQLHEIKFSIVKERTIVTLGANIKCFISRNLMKMFGFTTQVLAGPKIVGIEAPMTLDKREQHLYIQSDSLIKAVSFGNTKEFIMRDFIHNKDSSYGIIEKLFEPILYHPVMKKYISVIHIAITNGLRECIHLEDTKTLVTLIFRRRK